MTTPPDDARVVPVRWIPLVIALVLTMVETGVHLFTLGRIASWQPGYPSVVVFGLFTPPGPIRALHKFGPFLLVVALAAVILASVGPMGFRRSRKTLLWAGGGAILFFFVLYSWSLLWVVRASRYAG